MREVDFVFHTLESSGVRNNESAWNYLRGLAYEHTPMQPVVKKRLRSFVEDNKSNIYAMSLLADLLVLDNSAGSSEEAQGYYSLLCALDNIREKFWQRKLFETQIAES